MADLTAEQFEQVPEFLKEDYTEVDGVYKHAGMMKVKQTANDLDTKLKAGETAAKLAETTKAQEITDAIGAALAKAIEKGDGKEQLRLEREKLDDEARRITESRGELEEIQSSMAGEKKNTIIERLALKASDSGRAAFKRLVKDFIHIDPKTRQETFLNEDGSASSLNEESFYTEFLFKNDVFKTVLKPVVTTTGGGNANGSTDGSATQKAPKDMNSTERLAFKNRDPAAFKAAFKL